MRLFEWFTPCILFLALTESAAAALLAEWTWQHPVPLAAPAKYQLYSFGVSSFGPLIWETETSNLTGTFTADAKTVESAERLWTTGLPGIQNGITMTVVDANGSQSDPAGRWGVDINWAMDTHDLPGWSGARYVPNLGLSLFGYDISGLERVVTPTSQTIRVLGELLTTAEVNGDGVVDAADYVLMRKGLAPGNWGYWRANFGESSSALGLVSVPEPASVVLLILAACLVRRVR